MRPTHLNRNPLYKDPAPPAAAGFSGFFSSMLAGAKSFVVRQVPSLGVGEFETIAEYHTEQKNRLNEYFEKDPLLLAAPFLKRGIMEMNKGPSVLIQNLIFNKFSPLYQIKHDESPDLIDKFNNIAAWTAPQPTPTIEDHKLLFSVRQLLLIQAIHELYDPVYSSTAVDAEKSWELVLTKCNEIKSRYQQVLMIPITAAENEVARARKHLEDANIMLQEKDISEEELRTIRENIKQAEYTLTYKQYSLDAARSATIQTTQNKNILSEIDAVIAYVTRVKAGIFIDEFTKYSESIPIGAHIMYDFLIGPFHAFHHGIYLGNNAVVEILNFNNAGKLESAQTVTHIHDFIRRSVNLKKMSPIIIRTYRTPFPAAVILDRALWTLGKYPQYNLEHENCETVASWIASNKYGEEHLCMAPVTKFNNMAGVRFAIDAAVGGYIKRKNKTNKTTKNKANRRNKTRGRR
jgi:hypothetical protein